MKKKPEKLKIEHVLLQYYAEQNQGLNEAAGHGTPIEQALRQLSELIREAMPEAKETIGTLGVLPQFNLSGADVIKIYKHKQMEGYNQALSDVVRALSELGLDVEVGHE